MDLRRLIRMTVGGLVCLAIGAVSLIAISAMFFGIADGTMRLMPWIGVLVLGALVLETFVLTVAGLILVIWALVAAIAGPPADAGEATPRKLGAKAGARTLAAPKTSAPGTPTAKINPEGGVSVLDPQKRRPPHA